MDIDDSTKKSLALAQIISDTLSEHAEEFDNNISLGELIFANFIVAANIFPQMVKGLDYVAAVNSTVYSIMLRQQDGNASQKPVEYKDETK